MMRLVPRDTLPRVLLTTPIKRLFFTMISLPKFSLEPVTRQLVTLYQVLVPRSFVLMEEGIPKHSKMGRHHRHGQQRSIFLDDLGNRLLNSGQ